MSEIAERAKEETVRQTIILLFSVAAVLTEVYVMRKVTNPDMGRTVKMAAALQVKRLAQRQVDWWQNVSDRAATAYHKARE